MRIALVIVSLVMLSACGARTGPAGQPSSTDVNPVTGSRGGTNGR